MVVGLSSLPNIVAIRRARRMAPSQHDLVARSKLWGTVGPRRALELADRHEREHDGHEHSLPKVTVSDVMWTAVDFFHVSQIAYRCWLNSYFPAGTPRRDGTYRVSPT